MKFEVLLQGSNVVVLCREDASGGFEGELAKFEPWRFEATRLGVAECQQPRQIGGKVRPVQSICLFLFMYAIIYCCSDRRIQDNSRHIMFGMLASDFARWSVDITSRCYTEED